MITRKQFNVEDTSSARLQASPEGVSEFAAARFGLSMHWGLYSINGRGEWVYYVERVPLEQYRQRAKVFNPTRFDAQEWADLMLESGQSSSTITSKHHDGFCLWDTDLTDWKITHTPFKRDVIAELAPRCATGASSSTSIIRCWIGRTRPTGTTGRPTSPTTRGNCANC